MVATVFYLSIPEKYTNSKQKTYIHKIVSTFFRKYFKRFTAKTWLNGHVCDFSVDYNIIDTSHIIKYLMEKHSIK